MTIHVSAVIDVTKVKIRWEDPYVSEALDKMMSGFGRGIHHGFRMTADGGQIVRLSQDTEYADSLALIGDDNNDQVFVYREATEATIDFTPVTVGTRAWVFLHVDYSIGLATTAEIRVVDAAELGNAWVNAALLLGTVRKPAAGAISAGDIDHGSAEMLGLTKGDSSRWVSVNENPYWQKDFAGWAFTGAADSYRTLVSGVDSYKGTNALRLGDISGAQAPPDAILAQLLLPPLLANDIVFWRFKAKSSSVTNGAFLRVDLGAFFSETILAADLASFEQFGYAVEITADATGETLDIVADLLVGATTTGFFDIDEVEVFIWRPTGTVVGANMDTAARRLTVEAGANEAFFHAPSGQLQLVDKNVVAVDMTDPADGTGFTETQLSMMSAMNFGLRSALFQDVMWPKAVLSIGANPLVTDGTSGGSNVDIAAFVVRAAVLNPIVAGTPDRRFEQPAAVDHALPVTAGVEEFFVAWDPATLDVTSFLTSAIGANPDVVILAYVVHDSGSGLNTRIVQMQDILSDLEKGAPITVSSDSPGARFASLEGALRMAQASGFSGMKEFVLSGTLIIGSTGIGNFPATIDVPVDCLIRGDGTAGIGIWNYGGANPTDVFNLPDSGEVIFQDLYFSVFLSTGANVVLFASSGTPKSFTLRNITVDIPTTLRLAKVSTVVPSERLVIDGCRFGTSDNCIEVTDASAPSALRVEITNTDFGGLGSSPFTANANPLALVVNSGGALSESGIFISDCRFMRADGQLSLEGRVMMVNCYSMIPVKIIADNDQFAVTNLTMDLDDYIAATTPLSFGFSVEDADGGSINGLTVRALGSGTGFDAVQLGGNSLCDNCVYSDVSVRHTDGDAINMSGSTQCTLTGFTVEAVGASTRLGLRHGLGSTRNVISMGIFVGYATDTCVDATASSESIFNTLLLRQTGGAGTLGFVANGTNNTVLNNLEKL